MSKQQRKRFVPKVELAEHINIGELRQDLRQQWVERSLPADSSHYERARHHLDTRIFRGPKAINYDQLVYDAARRYLAVRPEITPEVASAQGFKTAGGYAGHLVVGELVSPPDDGVLLSKVEAGIDLAKIALQKT